MVRNILNLEGVTILTREQQKKVNGGRERCQDLEIIPEIYGPYNGDQYSPNTCVTRCRGTFLGIGLGAWGDPFTRPC